MVTGVSLSSDDSDDALFDHFFGSPQIPGSHTPSTPLEDQWLKIGNVSVNLTSGEVKLPDTGSISNAARSFWREVQDLAKVESAESKSSLGCVEKKDSSVSETP